MICWAVAEPTMEAYFLVQMFGISWKLVVGVCLCSWFTRSTA